MYDNQVDKNSLDKEQQKTMKIVMVYPFAILLVAVVVNLIVSGFNPLAISLPTADGLTALIIGAVLLIINHTWLMTVTSLTRVRFKLHSSPEEWKASDDSRENVTEYAKQELERTHNTHRNTTENTVYFVLLALLFATVLPPSKIAYLWIVGFPLARLGYTYSFLFGKDNLRGLFMSLSLLAMYGMASYLFIGLFI